jgi:hypothetical protein
MRLCSLLATAPLSIVGAAAAGTPSCTAATFQSLTLGNIEILSMNVNVLTNTTTSNIEILSMNVNALSNTSTSTGGTPESDAEVSIVSASVADLASTVDICQIAIQYTHPGQNDVINTYIGLPLEASSWNSRFVMNGGSRWTAGGQSNILSPVASGYSSSSTDGGHNASATTAEWGLVSPGNTNWPALVDFASVALDEAASLGKLATRIYFGTPPKFSYWNGCSTGGRQGHMMAQRYPNQFDGIVAGSPAINWERFQLQQSWSYFMAQLLGN